MRVTHGLDLEKAIEKARAALGAPRPPMPDIPSFERLSFRDKQKDEEITKRLKQQRKKKVSLFVLLCFDNVLS